VKFGQTAVGQLLLLFIAIFSFSFSVLAQDSEPVVVDEVVAQVNDGVITLSRVKREIKNAVDALVQQGGKTPEQAQTEMDAKRNEIIASLINEELLLQQGKELGLEQDVEAEVNARFVSIMKEQKLTSLDELYNQMRQQGLEPDNVKANLRKEMTKQMVLNRDVDARVYYGITEKEAKAYFEQNKDKFKKAESVKLSEIFLNFAGRDENQVKAEAAEIVKKARAGADFTALVAQYSERTESKNNKGSVGTFEVNNLSETIGGAIKNVKAGGVAEPLRLDEGMMILRVDERTADSATPTYDERRVREAITGERASAERKKYMGKLREDGYIKISETYRTAVSQFLNKDQAKN
jgi:peptidyl-prolyl cis-trans isomerase SurA